MLNIRKLIKNIWRIAGFGAIFVHEADAASVATRDTRGHATWNRAYISSIINIKINNI